LEANPRLAEAHLYKGNCYANKEDFEKAIREYGLAIDSDPGYSLAYYNRAVARYSKQDYAGAWQDIRVAQSLGYDPHPVFLEQLKEDSGKGE
jgi:tetratricopeptide (TPR) repeat protein